MCFQKKIWSAIATTTSENKKKLIKSIINIIRKLKSATGVKREEYLNKVRKNFNIEKNERYVITKLRMILIKIHADVDCLQIDKSSKLKITKEKAVENEKLNITEHISNTGNVKDVADQVYLTKQEKRNSKKVETKVNKSNKMQSARKPRKSLESRQLEKLRKNNLCQEETMKTEPNKIVFLGIFNLQPHVRCL